VDSCCRDGLSAAFRAEEKYSGLDNVLHFVMRTVKPGCRFSLIKTVDQRPHSKLSVQF
jgi:hypothetical protein